MLEFLIAAIPLLILLGSLLLGRYPGCDAIVRLGERIARSSVRLGAAERTAAPRQPYALVARGGLLLAFGFAKRPPPLAA